MPKISAKIVSLKIPITIARISYFFRCAVYFLDTAPDKNTAKVNCLTKPGLLRFIQIARYDILTGIFRHLTELIIFEVIWKLFELILDNLANKVKLCSSFI